MIGARDIEETSDEISRGVCRGSSFLIRVGFPFFEWRFWETRQGRLRLRLLEDEVLRLHDRSQDARAVRLWNSGRTADEASAGG
jgi:hypothetical protein